jgi:chromosome segregation ATPase
MSSNNFDYKVVQLKQSLKKSPLQYQHCQEKLADAAAELSLQHATLNGQLASKDQLAARIESNIQSLNKFVSQKNIKEQEPINTMRQLEIQLQELAYKVKNASSTKNDIDKKRKALTKATSDESALLALLESQKTALASLDATSADRREEVEALKRRIEGFRIKIAMRKMKLELANSNLKIKEYLMSIIRHNNSETVDFQSLFSSNDNARAEIRKILKEFIHHSKGIELDVGVSDAQIDEIIEKDQKEFDDIRRIYTELVQIINQYGDFKIYIQGIQTDIVELSQKLADDEKLLKELSRHLDDFNKSRVSLLSKIDSLQLDATKLTSFIAHANIFIDEKVNEIDRVQHDFEQVQLQKDQYLASHKVRSLETH